LPALRRFFGFARLAEATALKNQAEDNPSLGEKYEF
jgi:hypothetical protein